jgi:predicted Zn-dependent protease
LRIQALRLAGRAGDAAKANDAWLADYPRHVPAAIMRAVMLQAAGDERDALAGYLAVLDIDADNVIALNNAAWVSHTLGESNALPLAERAYAALPDNAAVLDTLGWILLAEGQTAVAIERLERAVELAPSAPQIRYHLAEALVAGGQSAQARDILESLLAEAGDFDDRAEAQRLLESMQPEVAAET